MLRSCYLLNTMKWFPRNILNKINTKWQEWSHSHWFYKSNPSSQTFSDLSTKNLMVTIDLVAFKKEILKKSDRWWTPFLRRACIWAPRNQDSNNPWSPKHFHLLSYSEIYWSFFCMNILISLNQIFLFDVFGLILE